MFDATSVCDDINEADVAADDNAKATSVHDDVGVPDATADDNAKNDGQIPGISVVFQAKACWHSGQDIDKRFGIQSLFALILGVVSVLLFLFAIDMLGFLDRSETDCDNGSFGAFPSYEAKHRLEIRFHIERKLGFLRGVDSEKFMNVFMRIGFGSTIELVSFDKSQVVTFDSKFVSSFRNSDCGTRSQSDNMVSSPHGFIVHWIIISNNIKKVTEVVDVKNWRVDNSRVLWWIISLIVWNSSVSSMKSSIQSSFGFRLGSESSVFEACCMHPRAKLLGQFA
ncbi:hypothetical protein Tco_0821245 [Tanacetum coccineum]|uniref:Uncharacterized protein n=1 Tax=Tanacetum coccineum TaxID=301880 RepID=A0ABQ5AFY3_9ASTR